MKEENRLLTEQVLYEGEQVDEGMHDDRQGQIAMLYMTSWKIRPRPATMTTF